MRGAGRHAHRRRPRAVHPRRVLRVRRRRPRRAGAAVRRASVAATTSWGTPALDLPAAVRAALAARGRRPSSTSPARARRCDDRLLVAPGAAASASARHGRLAGRRAVSDASSPARRRPARRASPHRRRAGGDRRASRVVAVTKGFGADAVEAARRRRAATTSARTTPRSCVAKAAALVARPRRRGALHRPPAANKVRQLAPVVDVWQCVDRAAAVDADRAPRRRRARGARAGERDAASRRRAAAHPDEAPALVDGARRRRPRRAGLMAVGPAGEPADGPARVPPAAPRSPTTSAWPSARWA